jgi:hypothetical protein
MNDEVKGRFEVNEKNSHRPRGTRRPYIAPRIQTYGNVGAITGAISGVGMMDGGMGKGSNKSGG